MEGCDEVSAGEAAVAGAGTPDRAPERTSPPSEAVVEAAVLEAYCWALAIGLTTPPSIKSFLRPRKIPLNPIGTARLPAAGFEVSLVDIAAATV
jgi:hypothetical protein